MLDSARQDAESSKEAAQAAAAKAEEIATSTHHETLTNPKGDVDAALEKTNKAIDALNSNSELSQVLEAAREAKKYAGEAEEVVKNMEAARTAIQGIR